MITTNMKFKITLLLILITSMICPQPARSQAFSADEKIDYEVYYHLAPLWFNIVHGSTRVDTEAIKKHKAFKITTTLATHDNYKFVGAIHDTIQAWLNQKTLHPLYLLQIAHEGNSYNAQTTFDYKVPKNGKYGVQITINGKHGETQRSFSDPKQFFDIISFMFTLRNEMNSYTLKTNETHHVNLLFDDGIYPLTWSYLGTENITLKNKETYNCIHLKIETVSGRFFDKGEYVSMWLSNDSNFIPIMVETKLKLGSIKMMMSHTSNLKYQLNRVIK